MVFDCNMNESATCEEDLHKFEHLTTDTIEIGIYIVCLAIGGPLNLIALYHNVSGLANINCHRKSIDRMLLLRLNLNIADLSTMFIYTLTQIIWLITYEWYGGDILCRVCKFFYTFGFYLNSFVVVCIAIDRVCGTYQLNRLRSSRAVQRVWTMLMCAWLAAFVFSLPQAFIFRQFVIFNDQTSTFTQCAPIWTIRGYEHQQYNKHNTDQNIADDTAAISALMQWERIYNLMHLLFLFVIPSAIIIVSYVLVRFNLDKLDNARHRRHNGHAASSFIDGPSATNGGNDCLHAAEYFLIQTTTPARTASNRSTTFASTDATLPFSIKNSDIEREENVNQIGQMLSPSQITDRCSLSICDNRHDECSDLSLPSPIAAGGGSMLGPIALNTISRARSSMKRQTAAILLAYLVCYSPYNLLTLMFMFADNASAHKHAISLTLTFLNSLMVINSIVNPLIYGSAHLVFGRRRRDGAVGYCCRF